MEERTHESLHSFSLSVCVCVCVCVCVFSHVRLCDSMDCILQHPLSTKFSRPEYWSGLPFPSPGALPHRDGTCGSRISCIGVSTSMASFPLRHQGQKEWS